MTNIFSLSNIPATYITTGYVILGMIALFVAIRIVQKLAAWVRADSKPKAYNPKLSRAARESLMREGIKPQIKQYNNRYASTRNRTVYWN